MTKEYAALLRNARNATQALVDHTYAALQAARDAKKPHAMLSRIHADADDLNDSAIEMEEPEPEHIDRHADLVVAVRTSTNALEDYAHHNVAQFTGHGDGEVPQAAQDWVDEAVTINTLAKGLKT